MNVMPTENPYRSHTATSPRANGVSLRTVQIIVGLMMGLFIAGVLLNFAGCAYAPLRDFLMPRFGWGSLVMNLNVALFLGIWFKTRKSRMLKVSAGMCIFLGIMESGQLLLKGTTSVVSNPFHDRLHSSWAYSVLPLVVAAILLVVLDRLWFEETPTDN